MAFLLNFQAQGASGKNEQFTQTPWRGAQCSCIGCISLRPALCVAIVGGEVRFYGAPFVKQLYRMYLALRTGKTDLAKSMQI